VVTLPRLQSLATTARRGSGAACEQSIALSHFQMRLARKFTGIASMQSISPILSHVVHTWQVHKCVQNARKSN